MNNIFAYYLKLLLALAIVFSISIVIVNLIIDPYGVFNTGVISVEHKPDIVKKIRLHKAFQVDSIKPSSIILGSSRGDIGFDVASIKTDLNKVYNLSLPAGTIYESLRYLQLADSTSKINQVILGLGLRQFNCANQEELIQESYLNIDNNYNSLKTKFLNYMPIIFSHTSLISSIKTIFSRDSQPYYFSNGMSNDFYMEKGVEKLKGHKNFFISSEKSYVLTEYKDFSMSICQNDKEYRSTMDLYKKIINIAYKESIDLKIVIYPSHARQYEVINLVGLWKEWEDWKRNLVEINDNIARDFKRKPFDIWDFSGYSKYNTEPVPALNNNTSKMRWYWESSHFKKELGDLILRTVINKVDSSYYSIPFGKKITTKNIDQHLEEIKRDRGTWIHSNPDDVSEINDLKILLKK